MYTLGIETSCDETACAVLKNGRHILANVVSSSLVHHQPFGGVVPEIASRHCLEAIDRVYKSALRNAKLKQEDLDLIAVTRGPGLIGSILVGVSFAKALAFSLDIPLVGVSHIEAHLEANFIAHKKPSSFIGLIVSGGHTSLLRYQNGRYRLLGETVDDAIGEAYDKVAKILGLGYPGGPAIDRVAKEGSPNAFKFTKPKQDGKYDFSFSGIKTAVLNLPVIARQRSKALPKQSRTGLPCRADSAPRNDVLRDSFIPDVCASFQESVMSWVAEKTLLACQSEKMKNIVVGGGVSANSRLRQLLQQNASLYGFNLYVPPLELTTDNAAMIARMGDTLYKQGRRSDDRMIADPSLKIGN